MKVLHSTFVSILYGTNVKIYFQGKTKVLREKAAPMPIFPPLISRGLARDRTRASVVRGPANNHLSRDTTYLRLK
jgi:hypothetical protein